MSKKKNDVVEGPMKDVIVPEIEPPEDEESGGEERKLATIQEAEAYLIMERRDEAQIVAALEGRYIEEFVYEFESGGRKVTGLSWIGIQEASREYGGIECRIAEERETDTHIIVTVEARDIKTGSIRVGRSKQKKMMVLRSGKLLDDEFADIKAISKAQRNAIRPLLPQTLLKQWIERHREKPKTDKGGKAKKEGGGTKAKKDKGGSSKKEKDSNKSIDYDELVEKIKDAQAVSHLSNILNKHHDIWSGLEGEQRSEFIFIRDKKMAELKGESESYEQDSIPF